MGEFRGEKLVTVAIKNVQPAVKGSTVLASGVTLTDGDVVLFTYDDYRNVPHAVVVNSGNALAVRS
jgi:hypothetical protein